MMKKIMLAALSATTLAMSGNTAVSSTGFFGVVNGGGVYTKVKLQSKHDDQEAKDRQDMLEISKDFAGFIGAGVGYGYEFANGFYVGGQVYGLYDFTKIEENKSGENITLRLGAPGTTVVDAAQILNYTTEYKPMFSYGASLMAGYKIMPNILLYASCGFEATYSKAEQCIVSNLFGIRNGSKTLSEASITRAYEGKDGAPANETVKATGFTGGNEEMKVTTFSIAPGLGLRWFITPNVFFGAEAVLPIGIRKKVDEKYYNLPLTCATEAGQANETKETILSLKQRGGTLYANRTISVRYGVNVGFRF